MALNSLPLTLLAGAVALAFPMQSTAQATDAEPPVEKVVVTGSRVIVNGDSSPTPVTAVRAQELLALQPSTIADALNTLPVFSSPRTQTSNPSAGATGVSGGGNPASNQLNLRNLGAVRTLILFDGHRVAPTTRTARSTWT